MQPDRPGLPKSQRPDATPASAGTAKTEPPSAKNTDLATILKNAEARLAEAEKRIQLAAESHAKTTSAVKGMRSAATPSQPRVEPRVKPAAAVKKPEARPIEPLQQPPAEPHIEPAAAAMDLEAQPTETQQQPLVEPHIEPAATASDTEAQPTEAQQQPPAELHIEPDATASDTEVNTAETQAQPQAEPQADISAMLWDMEVRLAEAEKRASEHQDAYLRARAETENVRRRAQEEIAKASKFAAEKFGGAMLPIKDSLEAALAAGSQTPENLREGVEVTLKQLVAAFESASLTEENPIGQKFDPNKHQAIGVTESEAEPNTVIHVLQKGYLLHGRVIRPAMVMVTKAKT